MQWIRRSVSRFVTGDGLHKTRFHTYSGRPVDWTGFRYLPCALWSTLLLKCFGYRQRRPWLGYRAVKHLGQLIQPDWRVLEFGSGMSSLFLARRCEFLVSVESDPSWHDRMRGEFARAGVANVDYRLSGPADYARVDDYPDRSFDLVIIDGLVRDQAARVATRKVKPRGYLYLDNSDVRDPEYQAARDTLFHAAKGTSDVRIFTDFTPFNVQVGESLLVRV
jgi:predicted O-methyltransferase YrrM